jgi:tape measure domain-containing protein
MSNVLASLIVKIGADIKDYSDGLKQATSLLSDVGRKFEAVGTSLTAAVTLPLVGLGAAAVNVAGKFEQTQIAFTHFLGSTQAAKSYLAELYNFAATTPFEIGDVTKGAQSMMAMGFAAQDVIPDLRILGDQLSAVGRTENMQNLILAFGQMKAKGTASMEELRQMMESGVVPAVKYLAEGLGKTETEIFSMLQNKAIDSGTAIKIILTGMAKDTGGLMSEQMASFNAQLSNLKDKITLTLKDVGASLLPFASSLLALGAGAAESISGIAHSFAGLSAPIQGAVIAIAALAAAAGPAFLAIGAFARTVASIAAVWPMVQTALSYGAAAFAAIASPIGVAVAAVAAVVAGLYIFRDATFSLMGSTYQLRDVWNAAWGLMKEAVNGVWNFFGSVVTMIRDMWKGLTGWMSSLWGGAFGVIGDVLKTTIMTLLGWAKAVLGALVPDFVIKALDDAKKKRDEAAAAAAAQADMAAKNAAKEAAASARKQTELQAELEAIKKLGAASSDSLQATGSRFTQFWTAADRSAFAMRQLGEIIANVTKGAARKLTDAFAEFVSQEPEFAAQSEKAAEAVGAIGAAMEPLASIMSAVSSEVTKLSDAFDTLGITSTATLQKQADDALAAYNTIRSSGISTAHDIEAAWVEMEKARQQAAIASGRAISNFEKQALNDAERALGQHGKSMAATWKSLGTSIGKTLQGDLSRSITDVIFHVQSIGEAFKRMAQDVVGVIVEFLVEKGIEFLITKLFAQKTITSAIDVGEVMSYAAVAAAAAFASTAAIPIVGPILAPAAAAAAYAGTAAYAPLASFDKGGFIPEDMIAQVHKGEFVLTASQVESMSRGGSAPMALGGGNITINVNGNRNPRETARELMRHLKSVSPKFSPAS